VAAKLTDIGGILSSNERKLISWRTTYGIGFKANLLVHQESLDRLQDRLSLALEEASAFELIKWLGDPIIFVSPGYSVYDDGSMCPIRQVLNIRRSLLEAAKANRAGLPSIPSLGWNSNRQEDIDFLAGWLVRQEGKVRTVAVNAQTGTSTNTLALVLGSGMAEIERRSGRKFHWIVFGGRRKIELISEFIPRSRISQVSRSKDFALAPPPSMATRFRPI